MHQTLYWVAFLQDGAAQMGEQVAWASGKPGDEDALQSVQSDTDAYYGRLKLARAASQKASECAIRYGAKETGPCGWLMLRCEMRKLAMLVLHYKK
ncbi:MAG TPA: hypothetical protein VGI45_26585 [Terracidiphilus sp.]